MRQLLNAPVKKPQFLMLISRVFYNSAAEARRFGNVARCSDLVHEQNDLATTVETCDGYERAELQGGCKKRGRASLQSIQETPFATFTNVSITAYRVMSLRLEAIRSS